MFGHSGFRPLRATIVDRFCNPAMATNVLCTVPKCSTAMPTDVPRLLCDNNTVRPKILCWTDTHCCLLTGGSER